MPSGLRSARLGRLSAENTMVSHATKPTVVAIGITIRARPGPVMPVAPFCGEARPAAAIGTAADMVPVQCCAVHGDVSIVT